MAKLSGKALVAQGGGPTAVINQSLAGVVIEARRYPEISKVYGARHGVRGILNEDFLDLTQATTRNLEQVALTPASALGSTRDKPDEEYCKKMFQIMLAHEIRYFFYIGGNDSSDTCRIVNEQAQALGYELRTVHVPKTIDNDLVLTDHCPGQSGSSRRLHRNSDGKECGFPHRSIDICQEIRRRRPSSDIPAGKDFRS
jgi:6-phosphofructokinase 1